MLPSNFDQAMMFLRMGYKVAGAFDVGSDQRPKIPGVTDVTHDLRDGIKEADVILLHQVEGFPLVLEEVSKAVMSKPVILHAFGQGCEEQHQYVAKVTREQKNAYVVAYSYTDYYRYVNMGMPREKVRLIRFGKDMDEFGGVWTGRLPVCYMTCNSIIKRGEGCALSVSKKLMKGTDLPLLITGKETHEVSLGIDELTYEGMKNLYRHVRCYLAIGTQPAAYTLTPVEAMCSGTPVIAYDNGCGIKDEGYPVLLVSNEHEIVATAKALINDKNYAEMISNRVRKFAVETFDMEMIASQWHGFIETMI